MEKNGEGFHGMSSVNEYWKRVNKCELPDFESSSSDDESNESKSSCREYKDASCNVDLDQEFEDESIDGIVVTAKSSTNDLTLIETIDEDIEIKSSRYVRWDVLLSLGIGLWAVLCIVDFLHSEKSGAREWLYESKRIKKNVPKPPSVDEEKHRDWWFFDLWPYLWRIISISSFGGAYILLFVLLIVFCADPRLRKCSVSHAAPKNNLNTKSSVAKVESHKNLIVSHKTPNESSTIVKRSQYARVIDRCVRKIAPIKLDLSRTLYLQTKILSIIENRIACDKEVEIIVRKSSRCMYFDTNRAKEFNEFMKIGRRGLVSQLVVTGSGTFQFLNINQTDWQSIAKRTLYDFAESRTPSINIRTFDIEIAEYLKRTTISSSKTFNDLLANVKTIPARQISTEFNSTQLSSSEEKSNRIITSSPAFQKFLQSFKNNNCVS